MGVNDDREMLEVAKAEVLKLEAEVAELTAQRDASREVNAELLKGRAVEMHRLRGAIGAVLVNAKNYPPEVQARILGRDLGFLIAKTVEAVTALYGREA